MYLIISLRSNSSITWRPGLTGINGLFSVQSVMSLFSLAFSIERRILAFWLAPCSALSFSYFAATAAANFPVASFSRRPDSTPAVFEASFTYTTGWEYEGAILTAVCISEVVAPPISNGIFSFLRSISEATWVISSSDGVINPLRPMQSTFSAIAVSMIFSAGTITPRSNIS